MLKRYIWLTVATVFFVCQLFVGSALAIELDADTRTVKASPAGDTITLTEGQLATGKKLFNKSCAICHLAGITKTNPNIGLDMDSLEGAFPPRDSIATLVDYLKDPTTYDGLESIAELHPATSSADIYKEMRNLTEDDLVAVSGYILVQPKVRPDQWGRGKSYN